MWLSSERLTGCLMALSLFATLAASLAEDRDETSLLQVRAEMSQPAGQPQGQPQLLTSKSCHDAMCGAKEWEPFSGDSIFDVITQKYDWLTAYCKLTALPETAPTTMPTLQSACLLKGCLAEGNIAKGADDFALLSPWSPSEAEYCFREHCKNAEFDLKSTTLVQGMSYCDKRFGPAWRGVTAGPDGKGWEGEKPGSGLWECSRGTYHCDWGYCKRHYCDRPELLAGYNQQQQTQATQEKQGEQQEAMEEYAQVAAQMQQEQVPVELLQEEATPAQMLAAQMGYSTPQAQAALNAGMQKMQTSLLQAAAGDMQNAQAPQAGAAAAQMGWTGMNPGMMAPQAGWWQQAAGGMPASPQAQWWAASQAGASPKATGAAQQPMMDEMAWAAFD